MRVRQSEDLEHHVISRCWSAGLSEVQNQHRLSTGHGVFNSAEMCYRDVFNKTWYWLPLSTAAALITMVSPADLTKPCTNVFKRKITQQNHRLITSIPCCIDAIIQAQRALTK